MDAFLSSQKSKEVIVNGAQEDVWVVSESHRLRSCTESGSNPQTMTLSSVALVGDTVLSRNIVNNTRSFRQARSTAAYQDLVDKNPAISNSGETKQDRALLKHKVQLAKYASGKQDLIVLTLEANITAVGMTKSYFILHL